MNNNNYVVIQGWMCNELNLKGNELLVYALIYGFSQDGTSEFTGSRSYIANTFNISLPTVDKALLGLIEKDYITKTEYEVNKVKYNKYRTNFICSKETLHPYKETLPGGSKETLHPYKETLPNNIDNNITNKKENNNKLLLENLPQKQADTSINNFLGSVKPKKKDNLYSKCLALIDEYTTDSAVRTLLIKYLNLYLEMCEGKVYANQWEGLLNKLMSLVSEGNKVEEVINQSIEKGYKSFYPVNNFTGRKANKFSEGDGLCGDKCTQEELDMLEQKANQLQNSGKKAYF